MILNAVLDKVAVWRDRREVQRQQLKAAEDFVWTWSDTVDPDSHEFAADLDCTETNTAADLFRVFNFWNTANQLLKEHASNCTHDEPHPEVVEEDE